MLREGQLRPRRQHWKMPGDRLRYCRRKVRLTELPVNLSGQIKRNRVLHYRKFWIMGDAFWLRPLEPW